MNDFGGTAVFAAGGKAQVPGQVERVRRRARLVIITAGAAAFIPAGAFGAAKHFRREGLKIRRI